MTINKNKNFSSTNNNQNNSEVESNQNNNIDKNIDENFPSTTSKLCNIKQFLIDNPKNITINEEMDDFDRIVLYFNLSKDKKNYIKSVYYKLENYIKEIFSKKEVILIEKFNDSHKSMCKKMSELNNKIINMLNLIHEHNSVQIQHFDKLAKETEKFISNYVVIRNIEINSILNINISSVVDTIPTDDESLHDHVAQCCSPAYLIYTNNKQNNDEENNNQENSNNEQNNKVSKNKEISNTSNDKTNEYIVINYANVIVYQYKQK